MSSIGSRKVNGRGGFEWFIHRAYFKKLADDSGSAFIQANFEIVLKLSQLKVLNASNRPQKT